MKVPQLDLAAQHAALGGELMEALGRVVASGRFILGPEVESLEQELARRGMGNSLLSIRRRVRAQNSRSCCGLAEPRLLMGALFSVTRVSTWGLCSATSAAQAGTCTGGDGSGAAVL